MIKILNQNRQPLAILENAYDIGYERSWNEIWSASFSLPLNDPKNEHCEPLNYMELWENDELVEGEIVGDYIGLFRIIPALTIKDESGKTVTYQCEHVLATLLDDIIFGYHQTDNLPTVDNIDYILEQQTTKHWRRGIVEFIRKFSYKWENENGLLAPMFSIPKPFDMPYQWTHNTDSYPWTLNLVEPEMEVTCEARYGKNVRSIEREVDPTTIVNRIYPLGAGEGVNQVTIRDVNGGFPYVEDAESIAKYGVKAYIWPDKRFEDAVNLKASAEALLADWKIPKVTYRGSAADISSITGEDIDKFRMGKIIRWIDDDLGIIEARIVKESKPDIKGSPGDVQLEMGNKTEDLSTTQTDLERRQKINELYSQGATNYQSYSYNDNADQTHPAEIVFFLTEDVVKLNELTLWFETSNFRAYEKAIGGGGAVLTSTKSGGSSTVTSQAGGSTTVTSATGGQSTVSSEFASPTFFIYSSTLLPLTGATLENHFHAVEVNDELNHRHTVQLPSHQHQVTIGSHQHQVSIPGHVHDVELQDHEHALQFGIFKLPDLPTAVTIKVDGNTVPYTSTSGEDIDLMRYLDKDSDGRVTRGKHIVSITPNDLGRINAQINTKYFVQSRGSYTL